MDNGRTSFTVPEIVGVAAGTAAALAGVIVALGRSQAHAAREKQSHLADSLPSLGAVSDQLSGLRDSGREVVDRVVDYVSEAHIDTEGLRERAAEIGQRVDTSRVREMAAGGVERLRESGEDVLERVQESVAPGIAGAFESVKARAEDVGLRAEPATMNFVSASREHASHAVEATTSAARETVATLFWLIAASTVVYVALLSPDRREKVKSALCQGWEQLLLLTRDFQGYDEGIS